MPTAPVDDRPVILFDLDGTVLDSAPGIVASMQEAMRAVGVAPADEATLRSDLGPPPAIILSQAGVPEALIPDAVAAYRRVYPEQGMANAAVYPGLVEVLQRLADGHRLATATMKLIETATDFLALHGLSDHFEVIGGATEGVGDKGAIIAATRSALGSPPPEKMIMVGDRHSDISGGRAQGLRTVAVSWGYGSREELIASKPDLIIDSPDQLPEAAATLLSEVAPRVSGK